MSFILNYINDLGKIKCKHFMDMCRANKLWRDQELNLDHITRTVKHRGKLVQNIWLVSSRLRQLQHSIQKSCVGSWNPRQLGRRLTIEYSSMKSLRATTHKSISSWIRYCSMIKSILSGKTTAISSPRDWCLSASCMGGGPIEGSPGTCRTSSQNGTEGH